MALSNAEKEALELVAGDIERVASWMSGGRETEVLQIAEKLRSIASGDADTITAAAAEEAARQAEIEAARAALEEQQVAAEQAAQPKTTSKAKAS